MSQDPTTPLPVGDRTQLYGLPAVPLGTRARPRLFRALDALAAARAVLLEVLEVLPAGTVPDHRIASWCNRAGIRWPL